MTSITDREEFLLQVEAAMARLPLDVLQGRCSVSPLDLPRNNTVAREVTARLAHMRLQDIKERRYTEGQLCLSFPSSGGPPHYLGDLRHYNSGRPHAPLRYDKPLPSTMTPREKEAKNREMIANRNKEEEQLIKFLQTQENSRRVESQEDLFAMEDTIFAAQCSEKKVRESFVHTYESLPMSFSTPYDDLD